MFIKLIHRIVFSDNIRFRAMETNIINTRIPLAAHPYVPLSGSHPQPITFEGRNLPQQTICHWKGNLSKSPLHFRYRQNILISRLYEQFSRTDSAMAPEKNFKLLKYELLNMKFQTFKIYDFKANDVEIPLI